MDWESTRAAVELIGNKWTLTVLGVLTDRPWQRRSDLKRSLGVKVSDRVFTETLRNLQYNGLIDRHEIVGLPPYGMVEYSLTPVARSLAPVLDQLDDWWQQHQTQVEHARAAYVAERDAAAGDNGWVVG